MIGTLDWYDWLLLIRRTTKYIVCTIFYDFAFLRTKNLHISYYFAFYGHTCVTMAAICCKELHFYFMFLKQSS